MGDVEIISLNTTKKINEFLHKVGKSYIAKLIGVLNSAIYSRNSGDRRHISIRGDQLLAIISGAPDKLKGFSDFDINSILKGVAIERLFKSYVVAKKYLITNINKDINKNANTRLSSNSIMSMIGYNSYRANVYLYVREFGLSIVNKSRDPRANAIRKTINAMPVKLRYSEIDDDKVMNLIDTFDFTIKIKDHGSDPLPLQNFLCITNTYFAQGLAYLFANNFIDENTCKECLDYISNHYGGFNTNDLYSIEKYNDDTIYLPCGDKDYSISEDKLAKLLLFSNTLTNKSQDLSN